MGYRIVKRSYGIGWKVTIETIKSGVKSSTSVPKSEWGRLGLVSSMTHKEALAQIRHHNLVLKNNRDSERRLKIRGRLKHEEALFSVVFPKKLVDSFVFRHKNPHNPKWDILWRASQRVILSLGDLTNTPSEWAENSRLIYQYFEFKAWSMTHIKYILPLINAWGRFLCRQ